MFNNRMQDSSANCNILKHSLVDDLLGYDIIENQDSLGLQFKNNTSSVVSSRIEDLLSLVADTSLLEIWQPLFIDHDNFITTKMLSSYGSYQNANPLLTSGRIGIEDFFTFQPQFQHWNNTGGEMSIDWILNKANCPYAVYYGILGWYRKKDFNNSRSLGGLPQSIDRFPNGSRLTHSSQPNKIYIKISDELLYDITSSSTYLNSSGSWTFNDESTTSSIQISSFGDNAVFSLCNKSYQSGTTILDSVNLWIPDGDFFSYFYSDADKQISLAANIPSCSYVSAGLYNKYSNIYRIITLDEPRSFDKKDLRKTRAYKKLAHALSTSPFVNDFSVYALDYPGIREVVQQYIQNQQTITTIEADLQILRTTLINISKILQNTIVTNNGSNTANRNLFLDTKFASSTFNNNLITNQKQLFQKLINKYGAQLTIGGVATLSPKSDSVTYNNDGIVITQVLDSYASKGIRGDTLFNSQKIIFDEMSIKSETTPGKSNKLLISGKETQTDIPLADWVKPGFKNASIYVALTSKGNVAGTYRNDGIPFQNIYGPDAYVFESDLNNNVPVELSIFSVEPDIKVFDSGIFDDLSFLKSKISVLWEKINGPSGFFSKTNGIEGISPDVTFYAEGTGKFTVQCTISTPFGAYKQRKTFYVVDGRQRLTNPVISNNNYRKYQNNDQWINPPTDNPNLAEITPVVLNRDNLHIQISKINKIAINNMAGVVWPIKTNFQVKQDTGTSSAGTTLDIFELSKDYKFDYNTKYSQRKTNPTLQLVFFSNNTIIKIHSIFLEKIRTNETGCENCLSFYEPTISAQKGIGFFGGSFQNIMRYNRSNKFPSNFTLASYKLETDNKIIFDNYIGFSYPNISTELSPPIKSYGGYSKKFITTTTNTIPGHPLPNDTTTNLVSNHSTILPIVSGYKLDYRNEKNSNWLKMCYQKPLISPPANGSIIKFAKGVFHPNSGWIPHGGAGYQLHANRCGLLKFNPGARDSFSFIGPSLSKIKNDSIDIANNTINTQIFSSTIHLGIAKDIQWDPECSCEPTDGTARYKDNQLHKEFADIHHHISNHGYRNLAGGIPKQTELTANTNISFVNDEFLTDHDTDNNTISYSFAVTGPAILPAIKSEDGRISLRNPRVNNFSIRDIEVKLNFLNYVNTKNLVVWLEVDFDDAEKYIRNKVVVRGKPKSPIKSNSEFIDQSLNPKIMGTSDWEIDLSKIKDINNDAIYNYLSSLTDMNSSRRGEPFKLFLLNQENIEHNGFNFSVKFSDNASKYNSLYNTNLFTKITQQGLYQHIINNNDTLYPTVAATGYSDRESCLYHSIIKHNRLNVTNNTFSKFVSDSLFRGVSPDTGPCPGNSPKQQGPGLNGITKFTLKMMILDETDDMYFNDNIEYQYKTGFDTANNDSLSSMVYNSLCNWELILHVGPVHKPVSHTSPNITSYGNSDILSLINYDTDPQYPGYSFIADLSAYQHLLPVANLNAPYTCIADSSTCIVSEGAIGGDATIMIQPPLDVANYAVLAINAAYRSGAMGGPMAGLTNALISNPESISTIINWLRELNFAENFQNTGRDLYIPIYNKYPFGSPEKMLILFKKLNSLWYNAEVSILKYHNSPILKHNRYKFIKVQRGNGKYISEFTYKIINDYNELINFDFVQTLDCNCDDWNLIQTSQLPLVYNNITINKGDLVNINLISSNTANCSDQSGVYVAPTTDNATWIKVTDANLSVLSQTLYFCTQNSIICGGKPFFDSSLFSAITANKVIILPTRIPYDIFSINDQLECFDQSESSDPNPSILIKASVLNKALILKNNQYFSVLILDSDVSAGNALSALASDHIFFVFDNKTSLEDKFTKPYNIWGLDQNKELVGSTITQAQSNTHSIGSYGDLSLFLEKNLLSNNIRHNYLEKYHTIFNNKVNDKIKYNKIKIYDEHNMLQQEFQNTSCYGFAYSEKDLNEKIFDIKNLNYYITPEYLRPDGDTSSVFQSLAQQIKFSTNTNNDMSYRYGYIKAKTDVSKGLSSTVRYGELTIENDFIEYIPMRVLSPSEISQLENRLLLIDSETFTYADTLIGSPENTSAVLQSNNLSSILKHYSALPDDPIACYRSSNSEPHLCYKKRTEQKINDLYLERKEILDLLEYQTIKIISLSYTNDAGDTKTIEGEILYENNKTITIKPLSETLGTKINKQNILLDPAPIRSFKSKTQLPITDLRFLDSNILPKISPTIKVDSTTQAITITYDIVNQNHYWINIDPKQSTFKDFEKNPKILIETTYTCEYANFALSTLMKNNVCPFYFNNDSIPVGSSDNIDESFTHPDLNKFTYKIKDYIVEQNKKVLESTYDPAIKGWTRFLKTRYFNINGDQTLDLDTGLEITIRAEEVYLVPVTDEDLDILEYNDESADANILPGIPGCETTFGSPGGKGLIDTNGNRLNKSTRVCNIVNLDEITDLDVIVKRIPRMLRGVDLLSTINRYGFKNIYRQINSASPRSPRESGEENVSGAINNSLYYWTCFQKNPDTGMLEKTSLPDFFLLQNEMIFRAFFGSVDKIENKTNIASSYFPWELIPYEYSKQ